MHDVATHFTEKRATLRRQCLADWNEQHYVSLNSVSASNGKKFSAYGGVSTLF